jgi:hypothetical protein
MHDLNTRPIVRTRRLAAAGTLVTLILSLAACDSAVLSHRRTSQMQLELAPALGDDLANRIATAWGPYLDTVATIALALRTEDFESYHSASMQLPALARSAVDATIALLESDPSWSDRAMAEALAQGLSADDSVENGPLREIAELHRELDFEESKDRLIRMIATQPRRFGEAARAMEETAVHHTRLLMYVSKEMMKSFQRWQVEFARGQRTPPAT